MNKIKMWLSVFMYRRKIGGCCFCSPFCRFVGLCYSDLMYLKGDNENEN